MELDDLKQAWKHEHVIQKQTPDIMEMTHQKSKAPISSLKRSMERQMKAIAVLMTCIIIVNGRYLETTPGYILFFTLVAFGFAVIAALFINYRFTKKIETMNSPVKHKLHDYVNMLEGRLKWQYFVARLVVLILILLVELLPLFYESKMLNTWNSVSPVIRFSAYSVYFLIIYFISKKVKQNKYGQHLDHLKELLKDM